jgi:hypothetical protein
MFKPRRYLMLVAIAIAPAACATIIHGTNQDVAMSSKPDGATVTVDNAPVGKTPTVVRLTRNEKHTVRLELAGYEPVEIPVTRKLSAWFFGNLVIGGLLGVVVDAATGAMYNLTPAQLEAQFAKEGASARVENDHLYVLVVMQPDPSWQRIGELTPTR